MPTSDHLDERNVWERIVPKVSDEQQLRRALEMLVAQDMEWARVHSLQIKSNGWLIGYLKWCIPISTDPLWRADAEWILKQLETP